MGAHVFLSMISGERFADPHSWHPETKDRWHLMMLKRDDPRQLLASRFSHPASRSPLPAPRFPLPASRSSLLAPRSPLPASRSPLPASRFPLPAPRSRSPLPLLAPRSSLLASRSRSPLPASRSPLPAPRSRSSLPAPRFPLLASLFRLTRRPGCHRYCARSRRRICHSRPWDCGAARRHRLGYQDRHCRGDSSFPEVDSDIPSCAAKGSAGRWAR